MLETQRWLDFFWENSISSANWAIADKDEACAALKPGASATGGWAEGSLTDSGRFVRASIKYGARPDMPTPAPTPVATPAPTSAPTSAPGRICCFYNGCNSCQIDPNNWCNGNQGNCEGDCGGTWCAAAGTSSSSSFSAKLRAHSSSQKIVQEHA